jgi:hypothetical protein
MIAEKGLIPTHQFGFCNKHATVEQIRITNKITLVFKTEKHCSAIFLDASQVFDKVWHNGVLFKIQ